MEALRKIGDWLVQEQIGAGGAGAVYRCRSTVLDIDAAVKWVPFGKSPNAQDRFKREVKALISLGKNPHIAQVYGFGIADDGAAGWIAMELVTGSSVPRQLSEEGVIALLLEVGGALAFAHEQKIAHRDVKPANILFSDERGFVLVDFGIAKTEGERPLTETGWLAATLEYTPPEVWRSEEPPDGMLWDIYALGQVAYERLTGTRATPSGLGPSAIVKHKSKVGPLDATGHCSTDLAAIIRAATHPDPAQRIGNMRRLVQWTKQIRRKVAAPPPTPTPAQPTDVRPVPVVARILVAGVGVGLLVGFLAILSVAFVLWEGEAVPSLSAADGPAQASVSEPMAAPRGLPVRQDPLVVPRVAPATPDRASNERAVASPSPVPKEAPSVKAKAPHPDRGKRMVVHVRQEGIRVVAIVAEDHSRFALPALVPPGRYAVKATFDGADEVLTGQIDVSDADVQLFCTPFKRCAASPLRRKP